MKIFSSGKNDIQQAARFSRPLLPLPADARFPPLSLSVPLFPLSLLLPAFVGAHEIPCVNQTCSIYDSRDGDSLHEPFPYRSILVIVFPFSFPLLFFPSLSFFFSLARLSWWQNSLFEQPLKLLWVTWHRLLKRFDDSKVVDNCQGVNGLWEVFQYDGMREKISNESHIVVERWTSKIAVRVVNIFLRVSRCCCKNDNTKNLFFKLSLWDSSLDTVFFTCICFCFVRIIFFVVKCHVLFYSKTVLGTFRKLPKNSHFWSLNYCQKDDNIIILWNLEKPIGM